MTIFHVFSFFFSFFHVFSFLTILGQFLMNFWDLKFSWIFDEILHENVLLMIFTHPKTEWHMKFIATSLKIFVVASINMQLNSSSLVKSTEWNKFLHSIPEICWTRLFYNSKLFFRRISQWLNACWWRASTSTFLVIINYARLTYLFLSKITCDNNDVAHLKN